MFTACNETEKLINKTKTTIRVIITRTNLSLKFPVKYRIDVVVVHCAVHVLLIQGGLKMAPFLLRLNFAKY